MFQAELYIAQNTHSRIVWDGFPQCQLIRCSLGKPRTRQRGAFVGDQLNSFR